MSYQQQVVISTKGHGDMHDLTEQVAAIVTSSGTETGTVNIFNVGSTAAVRTSREGSIPRRRAGLSMC